MIYEELVKIDNISSFTTMDHNKYKTENIKDTSLAKLITENGEKILKLDWIISDYIIVETDLDIRVSIPGRLTSPGFIGPFLFEDGKWINEPEKEIIPNMGKTSYRTIDEFSIEVTLEFNFDMEIKVYLLKSEIPCMTTEVVATMRENKNSIEIFLKWMRVDYETESSLPLIEEVYEYDK